MKNILFIIGLFISISAFAQIPKGTSTVGGVLSLSRNKETRPPAFGTTITTTTNMGIISPEYGIFVINNLCVGADLSVILSGSTAKSSISSSKARSSSRGITVGPFVRYYLSATEKLYVVFGAGYSWGYSKADRDGYDEFGRATYSSSYKSRTSVFDLSAGLAYFLNPNVAIEGTLGYTNAFGKDRISNQETKSQQYGLGIGLRIFLRKS